VWLHIPSSVYSAVPDSWTPPSESLYQDLALYATSRGRSLPPRSWRRVCATAHYMKLLSGVTLPPSTVAAGVERWMESLEEVRARICPWPADAQVSEVSEADSLSTTSASPRKSSQDGYSGKTSEEWFQASLFTTDPKLWPTSTRFSSPRIVRKRLVSGGTLSVTENGYTGDFSSNTAYRHSSMSSAAWKRWATALRQDYSQRQKSALRTKESGCSYWATADANTSTYSNGKFGPNLRELAASWPTPSARDWKSGEASEETMDRNSRPLNEIACHYSHPDQETPKPGGESSPNTQTSRRRLSPDFTDWMMSLPGWTGSAPLETAAWFSRLRWRLQALLDAQG
jgi:hypothetical protein